MYDYFKGCISEKRNSAKGCFVTLETNGIGYILELTERDFVRINAGNEQQKMYALLLHKEDSMALYGFLARETRDIFQILLSVSGVGAKMAIALLNEFDACDLITLVIDGNFKELTRAKGVGPKLAQKIILELKDKLIRTDMPITQSETIQHNQAIADTQAVLISLGYEQEEINTALEQVILTLSDKSNSEELLRKTLTTLSM